VKLMVEADAKLLADQIDGRLARQTFFRE
jgi:hypothetical protein